MKVSACRACTSPTKRTSRCCLPALSEGSFLLSLNMATRSFLLRDYYPSRQATSFLPLRFLVRLELSPSSRFLF